MLIDRIFRFEKSFRKTGTNNGIEIKKHLLNDLSMDNLIWKRWLKRF